MPRVRADDYGAKHQAILDSAAAQFAKVGYPSAKLQDVAKLCGATKSMLYHYFPAKEHLLQALLSEHLERLLAEIEAALAQADTAERKLFRFIEVFVAKSSASRQRHISAMNDMKFLPEDKQAPIVELERKVTRKLGELLRQLNPNLPEPSYRPYTMMLIGMLNWTDLWFKPTGRLSAEDLCELVSRLFLNGFLGETSIPVAQRAPRAPAKARRARPAAQRRRRA